MGPAGPCFGMQSRSLTRYLMSGSFPNAIRKARSQDYIESVQRVCRKLKGFIMSNRHSRRREIVSQRVHRDALVDARREGGLMHGAVQLPRAQGFDGVQAREQPPALEHLALSFCHPP